MIGLDTSDYSVARFIDEDDRKELIELFNSIQPEYFHQLYNLFDVERRTVVKSEQLNYKSIRKICHHELVKGQVLKEVYFLRYTEGSFARVHTDSGTSRTIITFVDSENLVGGETLMKLEYKHKTRPKSHKAARTPREEERPPYGQYIRNVIVPFEVGESVVYGPKLLHGVSEVLKGSRIILACWFNPEESFFKEKK